MKVPVSEGVPFIVKIPLLNVPESPKGKLPEVIKTSVTKPPILNVIGFIAALIQNNCGEVCNVIEGNGFIVIEKVDVVAI